MSSEPTVIGIAVVEFDGQFLVGTRSANSSLAGMAEFPGGKVEPGESSDECAVRETLEETGIRVTAEELICSNVEQYSHGRVELHFWRCIPIGDASSASAPFCWISRADLATLQFPSGNAGVLKQLTAEV